MTKLTPAQADRACGALLGSAVGDALGAGYEFGSADVGPDGPQMIGGGLGGFAPGEWTDDTTMTWCIAEVAARRGEVHSEEALTDIARHFRDWFDTWPADIGVQTREVLGQVGSSPTGVAMSRMSEELHRRTGHTAGNGSLMRTAAVALPYLSDPEGLVAAAYAVSRLTHWDPRAGEACVLWCLAIRHAVLFGEFEIRAGLDHLDDEAAAYWDERLDEAEVGPPSRFNPNGWVVSALQAAWSAIVHTPVPAAAPWEHLRDSLDTAIRIGHDTDTVAAIAGALLGACWGASAVPAEWRRKLHGYPGIRGERLVELAYTAACGGPTSHGWPTAPTIDYRGWGGRGTAVRHPHDDGVWIGDALALESLPPTVTGVVSLCLVGTSQIPEGVEHVGFRLIDVEDPRTNPHLDFVLADAARTIAAMRAEGQEVFLHCVAAQSRTPTVAAAYSMSLGVPLEKALAEVCAVLPAARPNPGFRVALKRLAEDVFAASMSGDLEENA